MSVIRLVDESGQEVATCGTFAIREDQLADVTTFSSNAQTWMPTRGDVQMQVSDFKTPIGNGAGLMLNQIHQASIVVAALVRAYGGSITLTRSEIQSIDGSKLETFQTEGGGIMMRLKE